MVSVLAGCGTKPYVHKDFAGRIWQIQRVEVMPRLHTAILGSSPGKGLGPLPFENEQKIQAALTAATTNELARRGFFVKGITLPACNGTNRVAGSNDSAATPWRFTSQHPEASQLAEELHVDGLIYINAAAYRSTAARKAWTTIPNTLAVIGALCGDSMAAQMWTPWAEAVVQVVLVDGKTGDVLWATGEVFNSFDDYQAEEILKDLFDLYPKTKL